MFIEYSFCRLSFKNYSLIESKSRINGVALNKKHRIVQQTWVPIKIEKVAKGRISKIENFSKKGKEMEDHILTSLKMP